MNESNTTIPERIADALRIYGYDLDPDQLHIGGERLVMSAHKLVLTGTDRTDGVRVVIKASLDNLGALDIQNEHRVRELLRTVTFADRGLHFPRERRYVETPEVVISVTEFVEQERIFVDHELRDQFFMALSWFESQEEFHVTTYEHAQSLRGTVAYWTAATYMKEVVAIETEIARVNASERAAVILARLTSEMRGQHALIERYCGFLNHTDLVPHNVRIKDRTLYVLDQVSIWFGNKYEGWARFINYMALHNPPLARLFVSYIADKRGADDSNLLRLMRCYKAAVLLRYYARAILVTEGDLRTLSELRFEFWLTALEHFMDGQELSDEYISTYIHERDRLRSEDEKRRQREFAKA